MVWACFTGERLRPIIICNEGGIGANEYEDILYDGLFSLVDDILAIPGNVDEVQIADENTFLFMQDNAKCHKANEVFEFLKENNIPIMEWPAQSPDLNPLEETLSSTFFGTVQVSSEEFGSSISIRRDNARQSRNGNGWGVDWVNAKTLSSGDWCKWGMDKVLISSGDEQRCISPECEV